MDADMTDAKRDITFINYYEPIKKTSESTTETIPTTKRKLETKPGNKTSTKKSKNKVKTGDNSNATLFSFYFSLQEQDCESSQSHVTGKNTISKQNRDYFHIS